MKFQKFVPLQKMEEQADGTLHVYGIVTAEEPDLSNEVCDYNGTKPFYQAKVAEMAKNTSVEGMEKSIMPMREMHTLKAIGAGRTIEFDDIHKQIRMGFEVVDPVAVQKFKKGVLIGFSQGGAYVGDLVDDPVHKGCKRYVADPAEVSGVDAPCLPSALVDSMKGRTVTLAKADGATETVTLQLPEDRLDRIDKALDELLKREFSTHQREHDASTGAALPDGSFPIENEQDLKNAIHAYGRAGDKEKAKEHIISRAKALGLTHLLPDDWTGSEKAAAGGKGESMKITNQEELTKAAKTIHDHLEKLHEMHKAAGEAMEKHHEAVEKKHEAMGDHIEKCMKCAKEAAEGEQPEPAEKTAPSDDLAKKFEALEKSLTELKTANADLVEKMSKIPAPGAPHTGATADVSKTGIPSAEGVPAELAGILNTAPVQ